MIDKPVDNEVVVTDPVTGETSLHHSVGNVLEGNVEVNVTDISGNPQTFTFDITASPLSIQNKLAEFFIQIRRGILVQDAPGFGQYGDQRKLEFLHMYTGEYFIDDFTFEYYHTNPVNGRQVETVSQTEGLKNIFYNPCPAWMFRQPSESYPHIDITVDGEPVMLAPKDGDESKITFRYIDDLGEVTDTSLSGTTLTIDGTDLPIIDFGVYFAGRDCAITTATTTRCVCELESEPDAGTYWVEMWTIYGNVKIKPSLAKIRITLDIDSLSHSELSDAGGQLLTVNGKGFPKNIQWSYEVGFIIRWKGRVCRIIQMETTQLSCETQAISDNLAETSTTEDLVLEMMGETNSQVINVIPEPKKVRSCGPASMNPTEKGDLVIEVDTDITLDKDDLECELRIDGETKVKMNVVSVSQTGATGQVTCFFPGAYQAEYNLWISSKTHGNFFSDYIFKVYTKMTGCRKSLGGPVITQMKGSVLGGHKFWIEGENFGTNAIDHQIKFGSREGKVWSANGTHLYVESPARQGTFTETVSMIVTIKATDRAYADDTDLYFYTYDEAYTPSITAAERTDNNLKLSCKNVNGDTSTTSVSLDGHDCAVTLIEENTDTAEAGDYYVHCTISEFEQNLSAIYLTTEDGQAQWQHDLAYTPELLSVTPTTAIASGEKLTFSTKGIGKASFVTMKCNGQWLCQTLDQQSMEMVSCVAAHDFSPGLITMQVDGFDVACPTCDLQIDTANERTIINWEWIDKMLVIDGTNLHASSYKVTLGEWSTTSVVSSSIQINATFAEYITPGTYEIQVEFDSIQYAKTMNCDVDFTGTISSGLTCGFNGLCDLNINAKGLKNTDAVVKVCNRDCEIDHDSSTDETLVCSVPDLPTTHSKSLFGMEDEYYIYPEHTTGDIPADADICFNDDTAEPYYTTASTCFIEQQARPGHINHVNKFHVFLDEYILSTQTFMDHLFLEGQDSAGSWTLIHTFDIKSVVGLNRINPGSVQTYKSFRLRGDRAGACNVVTEFKLFGHEEYENSDTNCGCDVTLT